MILTLIKKQILEDILDIRFTILFAICAVMIPLTLIIGQRNVSVELSDYQQSVRKYEDKVSNGSFNALTFEALGFRPPSELQSFCIGLDDRIPRRIRTSYGEGIKTDDSATEENLNFSLYGKLDLLFVIKVVLSLAAIVLTFNTISGEKEQGTLRLMISNSLPRYEVIIAKYLGNLLIILLPLVLGLIIGLLSIFLASNSQVLGPDNLTRIALMFFAAIMYVSLFVDLGILVSVATSRSWTSIVASLFLWVILILVIPQTSGMIAEAVYPIKSRKIVNLEKDVLKTDIEAQRSKELQKIFREANYVDLRKPIVQKYQAILDRESAKIEQDYQVQLHAQNVIATIVSRISPASSLTFVFSALAKTGIAEMENFMRTAERFQSTIEQEVYRNAYADNTESGANVRLSMGGFSQTPRFQYTHVGMSETISEIVPDCILLIVLNITFLFLGVFLFLRHDVR